jgi:hypothetical protein
VEQVHYDLRPFCLAPVAGYAVERARGSDGYHVVLLGLPRLRVSVLVAAFLGSKFQYS